MGVPSGRLYCQFPGHEGHDDLHDHYATTYTPQYNTYMYRGKYGEPSQVQMVLKYTKTGGLAFFWVISQTETQKEISLPVLVYFTAVWTCKGSRYLPLYMYDLGQSNQRSAATGTA